MESAHHQAPHVELVLEEPRSQRPGRLASVVVEELAHRIISGTLPEGTVLPPEPALCEQFRFSRTVIREGLKLLQERGLVRVEQGRGTSVQPRDSWDLLDPVVLRIALAYDHEMVLLDDLIAVRRLLECEMARAAATRLTEDELAALAENVEHMASSIGDYERFRSFDLTFHAAVMRGSGSEIGRTVVRTIHMHAGQAPHLTAPGARASLERTVADHRAIHEALAARDGELAATRTAAHIDTAWAERRASRVASAQT
jgi:GntR family transcriptional regulator, galactonate operon transcriptional repressor